MVDYHETELEVMGTASVEVQDEVVTYPQNLLYIARKLIDDGQFGIGVVVSHMACEIATERSLSEAFANKGIEYLEDSVMAFLNGYNLANEKIRQLFTALMGDEIQEQSFWQKFKESAERRNKIIHKGLIVGKSEAEEALKAASELVTYLKK